MPVPPPPPPALDRLPSEIAAGKAQLAELDALIARAATGLHRIRARKVQLVALSSMAKGALRARAMLGSAWVPRVLLVTTAAFVVACCGFVVIDTLVGSRVGATGAALVGAPLTGLILGGFLVIPTDGQVSSWLERTTATLDALSERDTRASHQLSSLGHRQERLRREIDSLESRWASVQQSRDYRSRQLLAERWKELRAYDFEAYLARVFENLGYAVEQKGQSGDQGVDLVVTSEGVRIAIQAKGYESSVSNSAVQEVFTGSRIHGCQRCAVITNSRFTAGAIQAAEATECLLVHEDNFADFVHGRIRFVSRTGQSTAS